MRINPLDGLLFLAMRLLNALDTRDRSLAAFDPSKVSNILVVSCTAVGDTLLSTPAIRAVRQRYPAARIVAYLNAKNMELFALDPHIDEIVPYYGGYRRFLRTVMRLRREKFDLAVIFHGNEPQATPTAYLSGAPFVIKVPRSKEYGFLFSNGDNGGGTASCHLIDMRLKAASFAGCKASSRKMFLRLGEEERRYIDGYVHSSGLSGSRIVGFQVGAATGQKIWPKEHFVALGRRLLSLDSSLRIVVTGSRREEALCSFVAAGIGPGSVSAAGRFSLRQTAALVARMTLLVTNDTGTMHVAIALGTDTVSLFCPTDPSVIVASEAEGRHRVVRREQPCKPCLAQKCGRPFCMGLITVEEVFSAVAESLDSDRTGASKAS